MPGAFNAHIRKVREDRRARVAQLLDQGQRPARASHLTYVPLGPSPGKTQTADGVAGAHRAHAVLGGVRGLRRLPRLAQTGPRARARARASLACLAGAAGVLTSTNQ